MVHLTGLQPTAEQRAKLKLAPPNITKSAAENKENGLFDIHAGWDETSVLLFLRPDLVSPIYTKLQAFPANNPSELFQVARGQDWPGYIGSPRLATANYGAQSMENALARGIGLAIAILDGLDEREIPRYANFMLNNKAIAKELEGSSKHEADVERKQLDWMKKKGIQ